jgi:hypothetical protein
MVIIIRKSFLLNNLLFLVEHALINNLFVIYNEIFSD